MLLAKLGDAAKYGKTTCRFPRITGIRSSLDDVFVTEITDLVLSYLFRSTHSRKAKTPDVSAHEEYKMTKFTSKLVVGKPRKLDFYLIPLFYCDEDCKEPCRFLSYAVWHKEFAFIPGWFMLWEKQMTEFSLSCQFGDAHEFGKILTIDSREIEDKLQHGQEGVKWCTTSAHYLQISRAIGAAIAPKDRHTEWDRRRHDDVGRFTERLQYFAPMKQEAILLYNSLTMNRALLLAAQERLQHH